MNSPSLGSPSADIWITRSHAGNDTGPEQRERRIHVDALECIAACFAKNTGTIDDGVDVVKTRRPYLRIGIAREVGGDRRLLCKIARGRSAHCGDDFVAGFAQARRRHAYR